MRGFRNVCVLAIALLSAAGCEGEGGGGDTQVLPGASGTGGGASASGVDAGEGAGPESNNAGGAPAAQTPDALAAPTAQEPDAAPPEPDAAPLPTCEGEAFAAVNERATLEAAGLHYQGLDGEANPMNAVLLDIRDTEGRIGPGLYDLAGTNLADCEVCVAGLKGCNPATGRCQQVFYPKSGVVEITALGAVGEHFTATLHGVEFEEVTVAPNTNRSTPVEGGDTWCNAEQVIDLEILPRPVMLGEVVSDFQLQNCGTGEMVSMHELGANAKAMWFVASAGWCSACAQFLPGVFDAIGQIQGQLGADALKPVIIVGEDANYGQPDVAFCRSYADHYGADPNIFYVDHDGTGSFATTFQHIWPYIGPNGEFALPWNALVRGTTFEYFYADRSGESDLNTALNAILR